MIIYENLKNCDKIQIDWAHTPSGRGQGTCEGPLTLAVDPWGGRWGLCSAYGSVTSHSCSIELALVKALASFSCSLTHSWMVFVEILACCRGSRLWECHCHEVVWSPALFRWVQHVHYQGTLTWRNLHHCDSLHLSAVLMLWPISAWPSLWPCRPEMWLGYGPKDTSLALRSAARLVCQLWSLFTLACWHGLPTLSMHSGLCSHSFDCN